MCVVLKKVGRSEVNMPSSPQEQTRAVYGGTKVHQDRVTTGRMMADRVYEALWHFQ